MIEDGGFVPENVTHRFCQHRIFGIGRTVKKFVSRYWSKNYSWYECAPKSAGNGALMRIAPMVIPHLQSSGTGLWVDTALSARITHNDSSSIASCVAFVSMLRQLLEMDTPPSPHWWLDTYVRIAQELEIDGNYRPRGGQFEDYVGPLWRYVAKVVADAHDRRASVLEACNGWHSGAYLMETMPSVIYILMCHANEPEEAIVRAGLPPEI